MVRDGNTEFTEPTDEPGRRPRTRTTIAVLVAALAVVAAVLWTTFRGGDDEPAPGTTSAGPATTAPPSPSTTSATTSPSTPGVAPTGDADATARTVTVNPGSGIVSSTVPYLLDRTLHSGVKSVSYAFEPPFTYVPLAEGKAVIAENNTGTSTGDTAQLAGADGKSIMVVEAAQGHAISAVANGDGTRFALLDVPVDAQGSNGVLTLYDDNGTRLASRTGVVENLRPAGFVGDRLFLGNHEAGGSFVWDTKSNSISPYLDRLVVVSTSGDTGRAAFTELADYEKPRCATVADVTGDEAVTVSKTCGLFSAAELSDDGRYLLGIQVPSDGSLQSPARVIDADTGRPLIVFESEPMNIEARFMTDGSVGLNVYVPTGGAPRNTIVRCTIEGDCSRMVPTLPMPDYDQTLATRYTLVPQ